MKNYLAFLFLVSSLSLFSQNTIKIDSLLGAPNATINEVSFISGYWKGEALGGITEEIWSEPLAGSMMGSFKLVVNDSIQFYELCTISEENETLVLKIKHFSHDLEGWEEKNESEIFPLVKIDKNKVYFDGLTFEKLNENELIIYVLFNDKDANEVEMKFPYTLKN